jgi:hypothetical protein
MEDRILKIALEAGYELSTSEVLGIQFALNVDDPTDDDIYLWVLILSGSDKDDSYSFIDWASVKRDAILTDPALISLLEKNS